MSAWVYVLGAGVWTPEAPNVQAWLSGARTPGASKPAAQLLPARMRGRASVLTAMLAEVAEQAARAAGVEVGSLPSVFGSAYGEMGTTLGLLQQLTAAEALSPSKFQASVHNTAAGQLSIALRNPSFSTSLAAGHDTLAMSLLEACTWLGLHGGNVLLACADEAASGVLQPERAYPPLAAAFVLAGAAPADGSALARLGTPALAEHAREPARAADNPIAPALALVRAVFSGSRGNLHINPASALAYAVQFESYRTGVDT